MSNLLYNVKDIGRLAVVSQTVRLSLRTYGGGRRSAQEMQGYVISVRISDKGTTITDSEILNSALQAAMKAKFTPGEGNRRGYITYRFRLM
jgi:hypothetical protein